MLILIAKSILLLFLLSISIAILLTNCFIYEVIYLSIFSLIMALLYLVMKAPDVAITESAVGVCLTTLLLLWTVSSIGKEKTHIKTKAKNRAKKVLAFITVLLTAILLFYALPNLPNFGAEIAPAHNEVYHYYLENTEVKFGFPNVVTAILAGFRGYDTLGETVVIFTAAISILFLLKNIGRKN
jgi:multicomponent Na+:H+ antiporter subunit B